MKRTKKSITFVLAVLSLPFLFSLGGCNNTFLPGDGYIDTLPESMDDGVLLQAFNWTYNQIKANLPQIQAAGFKGVQTSPVQQPKSGGAKWEFFYQPVSFSIASTSPLGSKEELTSLCTEADKYGISIICDIVFNHMATTGGKNSDGLPTIDPEVETYEPTIYQHQDLYFHHLTSPTGSGATTQIYSGLPDLNTGNAYVQERALSLLKECIDVGVDGFRFDAAKHIETPDDPDYPSSFWPNTLEVAKTYYHEKTNKDLYAYGEILNGLDSGRSDMSVYTQYMKITDNGYISTINSNVNGDPTAIVDATYGKNADASNLVTWVESHDTYASASNHINDNKVAREWAVLASRKDTNCMYFARCDESKTVGKIASYQFEKDVVGASNRFHNRFLEAEEYLSASEDCFLNERISENDEGAVICNLNINDKTKQTVTFSHLSDGTYFDQMSSKTVVVKNGKATISFVECGVAVLTHSHNYLTPIFTADPYDCSYLTSLNISYTASQVSSGYYTINGGEEKSFKKNVKFSIDNSEDSVSIFVHLENHESVYERTLTYTLLVPIEGYFNIFNLKPTYLTDYTLYLWSWDSSSTSTWSQGYTYNSSRGILLINDVSSYKGFLLALFPKDYVITTANIHKWDSNVLKQSSDINPATGFFDASNF